MTNASLVNVVVAAFPVALAALTLRLYRPLLRKAGPAPPSVRHPDVPACTPDAGACNSGLHAYDAPPPDRELTVPLNPRPRRWALDMATPQRGVILIVSHGAGACRRRRRIAAVTTMRAR
jgi:hypothetical protein